MDRQPGMATWFLHFLEKHDLVRHSFNALDAWPTERGRSLLAGLERHMAALTGADPE